MTGASVPLPDPAHLPPELLRERRFVCWKPKMVKERPTKVPLAPWRTGHLEEASVTDPANWTDFQTALAWAKREGVGVGFVLGGGWAGIDLDKCIGEDGRVEEWAERLMKMASSYTELSPSGKGIHILIRAPEGEPISAHEEGVEAYFRDRFFTLTGRRWRDAPQEVREAPALVSFLRSHYGKRAPEIREAREGVPILKVLEAFGVKLPRRGKQLQGPHPVHGSETGMNFSVNPDKNAWFCYRCWAGGGPFTLVGILAKVITCRDVENLTREQISAIEEEARKRGLQFGESRGKLPFRIRLDGDRIIAAWKERGLYRITLASLQEGEVIWQDTQGVPFWRSERKRRETSRALQECIPDLTGERFEEIARELAKAEGEGKIPELPEGTTPSLGVFVPCLVTDEFIAEECWDREKEEAFFLVRYFGDGEIKRMDTITHNGTEYRPLVNPHLRKGMVLLPPGAEPSSLAEAFQEACDLALTMYDAEEGKKEEVKFLVAVALSSWFYDRFNMEIPGMGAFAPIIALRGPSGSGKDRLLNALRLVSYRPFYDVSTTRTPSLYRPMDQWRGTLCLSEMDFKNTGETSDLTHYLNCRAYGVPISRQNPDNPKYSEVFHNFGLTIVTQRRVWDDNATEDRSLPFYCEKTPREVPPEVLDEWVERGLRLQKKLLYLRLTLWDKVVIDKGARVRGVKDHRLNAAILPLLALSRLEPSLGALLSENLKKMEKRRREVKAMSKDGVVVNRLYELWKEGLIREHNGVKYLCTRKTWTDAGGEEHEEIVPLQVSDLASALGWSTREVRKVLNSLQLHPQLESLPKVVRLGDRLHRPIWVDEERLKSRFEEFVPDFEEEGITHMQHTTPPTHISSVTSVTSVTRESTGPSRPLVVRDRFWTPTYPPLGELVGERWLEPGEEIEVPGRVAEELLEAWPSCFASVTRDVTLVTFVTDPVSEGGGACSSPAPRGVKKVPPPRGEEASRLFWELVRQKAPGPGKLVEKRWLREELERRGVGRDQVDRLVEEEVKAGRLLDRGSCLEPTRGPGGGEG